MKIREKTITFLGKNTEYEGKLTFHGAVRIDGHFKGEILAVGNLFIGEEGKVEANIHISSIVIFGEAHGTIIADERIEMRAPGKVFGNIQTPLLIIDEGVTFEGDCRMGFQEKDDKGKLIAMSLDK